MKEEGSEPLARRGVGEEGEREGKREGESERPGLWQRQLTERVADCRVFQVRRDVSVNPRDGRTHNFYVVEAPDWINIIPLTTAGEVVLIEQYRHGTQELTLEIPGGMVDEGEEPRAAAAREMLEETGYASQGVRLLGRLRPNPAIQNNWIYTFLAPDARFQRAPSFDTTEHTSTRLVPLSDIPALIARGAINHALVIAGFHWLSLWQQGLLAEE